MKNFNASVSRRSQLTSFAAGLGVVARGGLTACGGSAAPAGAAAADSAVLTVAASPAPHAEILTDFAAPLLAEQGIKLKVLGNPIWPQTIHLSTTPFERIPS